MARVAMIGPVPADADKPPESGVAQYLADLVSASSGRHDVAVVAQADASLSQLGKAHVESTWEPNRHAALQINRALRRLNPDVVHLQHEFNLYGGQLPTAFVVGALGAKRISGRPLVMTLHGVVGPDAVTSDLLARSYLPNRVRLMRTAFNTAYRLLGAASTKVIVHHDHFRVILNKAYGLPMSKICTIPLGSDSDSRASNVEPGPIRILVLGFLTGYKQPESVVDLAESDLLPDAKFIFCVGKNPRITSQSYLERYDNLASRVSAIGPERATFRGFVPEDELPQVLQSADVLALPYTECISATAIAGIAQRYGLPVCYSEQLAVLLGDGPCTFKLNDIHSLADAVNAANATEGERSFDLFAPWSEVVARTEAVWDSVLR